MANKHLESLKFPGLSDIYTMTPEMASEYSSSATYAVGDYAVHSGKLYQCTTAISTAEAWTAAHWTEAKLADDVSQLKEDLTAIAIRQTVSGSIASFTDGAEDVPMKSLVVNIEPVQSGSGDPSPSNVRPISGWTAVNTSRNGINQWDEEWEAGYINSTTGAKASSTTEFVSKNLIPIRPNTAYYASTANYTGAKRAAFYDADKNYLGQSNGGWIVLPNGVFTSPSGAYYMMFYVTATSYNNDISINYPSTDTAYHRGADNEQYTTALGQTVYGGKLDVVTGELILTWRSILGSAWTQYNSNNGYKAYRISSTPQAKIGSVGKCNMINEYGSFNSGSMSKNIIQLPETSNMAYMALDESISASDIQLIYMLLQPITVQLTAQEVTSLLGVNNVFADAGSVDVTYCADGKMYIDNKIAELQALILEQ